MKSSIPTVRRQFDSADVERLRGRKPEAVDELHTTMLPTLVRYFSGHGLDPTRAEWLAHDILVDFTYRWVDTIERPGAIPSYLRAMALTALRRERQHQARHSAWDHRDERDHHAGAARMRAVAERSALERCLAGLTRRARRRLQLHVHLGHTYAEVARAEHVSAAAARKSILLALAALRFCMEGGR